VAQPVADLVGGFAPLLSAGQARRDRKRVGVDEFVDEAPRLELQAVFGGGNVAPACGGGLAVEYLANFLLQIVAFRDAHFRISNGSLPSSPSVSLEPIKSWWNRPTRLATGRRSYSKT
jgi:hypothetical protein